MGLGRVTGQRLASARVTGLDGLVVAVLGAARVGAPEPLPTHDSLARYARVSPKALARWQARRDPAARRR